MTLTRRQTPSPTPRVRRVIPHALRAALGRWEIKKTLAGSSPINVARSNVDSFVTELLSRAGRSTDPGSFKAPLDRFLESDIAEWDFDRARRDLLEIDGEYIFTDDQIEKLSDRWIESLIQHGDVPVDYIGPPAGVWIDITVRRAHELLREFIQQSGLKAWLEKRKGAEEALIASCNEALLAHTLPSERPTEQKRTTRTGPASRQGIPLSEALERYLKETRVAAGTARDWQTAVRRFAVVSGRDFPIEEITAEQIVAFRDALAGHHSEGEAALSLPKELAPTTVNKNLHALKAILAWSVRNKYLAANPAEGVNATVRAVERVSYLPFTSHDLAIIFGKSYPKDRPSNFWMPILGLFTGCREEEIAQLTLADVGEDRGIPFFDIRGKVKNKDSIRRVPIHSRILEMGFLEFCATRAKSSDQLFADLKPGSLKKYSAAYSKRFSRYIRKQGIVDERKVFHSFRHTFKDRCRDAELSHQVQDALLGHASTSVGERYGQGFTLRKLQELIAKLTFDDVDLSHLSFSDVRSIPKGS